MVPLAHATDGFAVVAVVVALVVLLLLLPHAAATRAKGTTAAMTATCLLWSFLDVVTVTTVRPRGSRTTDEW
jgi:hypothetical protein